LTFLESTLPNGELRLLEVGCGDGRLAGMLGERGLKVTGVDPRAEAVQAASDRGVSAVEDDFLSYHSDPYDVVLFSRSLHHIAPLGEAVEHARSLLQPGGLLVAEEFAVENVDRDTARWFYEIRDLLEAAGLIPPITGSGLLNSNQLERWLTEHSHDEKVHAGEDMLVALGSKLEMVNYDRAPYLYRYICDRIEPSDRGARVAQWMFEVESLRLSEHSLKPAGLRMVARK
jgi:SAM-dependent methyltransferase